MRERVALTVTVTGTAIATEVEGDIVIVSHSALLEERGRWLIFPCCCKRYLFLFAECLSSGRGLKPAV